MAGTTDIERVRNIVRDALHLGSRAAALDSDSRLLGAVPEFDSMAVVTIVTMLEEEYGITIHDDEISADVFETLGSLAAFLSEKTNR